MTLSNIQQHFDEYVWPGLGLFGESYILFSIGTIHPIWEVLYPQCFDGETCSDVLLGSLTYSVVIGIIIGMVSMGVLAGKIGRRRGSLTTAVLLTLGSLGLTFSSFQFHSNPQAMLKSLNVFFFIYGIGVGGEYPLSASSASERAMSEMKERMEKENEGQELENFQVTFEDESSSSEDEVGIISPTDQGEETNGFNALEDGRGKRVVLIFTMQGWGIFVNTLTLTSLLLVTCQFGNSYYGDLDDGSFQDTEINGIYNNDVLLYIWQIVYGLGTLFLFYVFFSRYRHLEESSVWLEDKQRRGEVRTNREDVRMTPDDDESSVNEILENDDEDQPAKARLMLWYYGHKLFGTSFSWLLWNVAFYGNKLFQSSFLYALTGAKTTLLEISCVALLNSFVALVGYYTAAVLVDRPSIGRVRLQQYGFFISGVLFCLCGYLKDNLPTFWLVMLYLGSSFFGQCGPNCTTFLIPAEIFPTELRTMCHGISAAVGKIGALIAAIMFNYLSESGMFLVSGYCSFLACVVTFVTIPESSSLNLYELDKKWVMTLSGKGEEYRGDANDFRHMSVWERLRVYTRRSGQ